MKWYLEMSYLKYSESSYLIFCKIGCEISHMICVELRIQICVCYLMWYLHVNIMQVSWLLS